ncbi:MAG: universal stress protein, partial [Candidatus Binatia bacterium]
MDKIKKLLAPTDLSELSREGVRNALEIARSQEAEVIVYHVIGLEEATRRDEGFQPESLAKLLLQQRKELLTEFLRENFADLNGKVMVRQGVEIGVPYKRIVGKAEEEGADMIVMCTQGRTGLMHMLIGSVTEKVVRLATCPV